jgi:hypothetical protein
VNDATARGRERTVTSTIQQRTIEKAGRRVLAATAALVAGTWVAVGAGTAQANVVEASGNAEARSAVVRSSQDQVCFRSAAVDGTNGRTYCFAYGYGPFAGTYVDAHYSNAATTIAGKVTYAICWGRGGWRRITARTDTPRSVYGFAYMGRFVLNLAPRVCRDLEAIAYYGRRPGGFRLHEIAQAVDTVAHETMHASYSIGNEAKAECFAIQYTTYTANLLGVTGRYARRLGVSAWRAYDDLYAGTRYWSPKCRNGGPWDLNPQSSVWP